MRGWVRVGIWLKANSQDTGGSDVAFSSRTLQGTLRWGCCPSQGLRMWSLLCLGDGRGGRGPGMQLGPRARALVPGSPGPQGGSLEGRRMGPGLLGPALEAEVSTQPSPPPEHDSSVPGGESDTRPVPAFRMGKLRLRGKVPRP